jgi:hypothetical protein
MNRIYMINQLMKRINVGKELMEEFPANRAEYLDETLHYSKLLFDLLKESALPW